jgi:hypothetical protein
LIIPFVAPSAFSHLQRLVQVHAPVLPRIRDDDLPTPDVGHAARMRAGLRHVERARDDARRSRDPEDAAFRRVLVDLLVSGDDQVVAHDDETLGSPSLVDPRYPDARRDGLRVGIPGCELLHVQRFLACEFLRGSGERKKGNTGSCDCEEI